MSYSTELKAQLAEREIKKNCCRRALLYGMLSLRGKCTGESISLLLEKEDACADLWKRGCCYFLPHH